MTRAAPTPLRMAPSPLRALIPGSLLVSLLMLAFGAAAAAEGVVTLLLDGGDELVGAIVNETEDGVELRLSDGSQRKVAMSEVKDFFFGTTRSEDEDDDGLGPGKPKVLYDEDDVQRRRRGKRPRGDRPKSGGRPEEPKRPQKPNPSRPTAQAEDPPAPHPRPATDGGGR